MFVDRGGSVSMVGSTIVQQAGLSVMNAQKGVLPHGWLEYSDEASGRPYYYNVHTKVTTWYQPTGVVPPPPPAEGGGEGGGEGGMMVNFDCTLETHRCANATKDRMIACLIPRARARTYHAPCSRVFILLLTTVLQ